MSRPIKAVIHMKSLRHNVNRMREYAAGRFLWAVVKANAYGHGLERAVRAFEDADGLAIIDIEDIVRARAAGWKKPILLLQGFFKQEDLEVIDAYGAEVVIHNREQIKMIVSEALPALRVHIKVNTGMNRFGFKPEDVPQVREELQSIDGVELAGIVTHFANAGPQFDAGLVTVSDQMAALGDLRVEDIGRCFANSAATIWLPECGGDAVRVGISLYGISPEPTVDANTHGIRAGMSLISEIIAVQEVAIGESVGYCSRFTATRPSRIGVVACGFADGYLRRVPAGSIVLVDGKRAPIVGNIAMDVMTVDLTDLPDATVGSVVELWGQNLPVAPLAVAAGTIPAELICGLTVRVPIIEEDS